MGWLEGIDDTVEEGFPIVAVGVEMENEFVARANAYKEDLRKDIEELRHQNE